MEPAVQIDPQQIAAFCRKWRIRELSLFGSVVTGGFDADSDVDVLVVFEPDDPWSLWDFPQMQDELEAIIGRPVDLVEQRSIRNPFRRRSILANKPVIYVA